MTLHFKPAALQFFNPTLLKKNRKLGNKSCSGIRNKINSEEIVKSERRDAYE